MFKFIFLPFLLVGCVHVSQVKQADIEYKDQVRTTIRTALPEIQKCSSSFIKKIKHDHEFKLIVNFYISLDGRAQNLVLDYEDKNSNHTSIANCVQTAISAAQFNHPPESSVVHIIYPFKFKNEK